MNLRKIGKHYHASYVGADGKTKTVTTKCTDKDEARRVIKGAGFTELESAAKIARFNQTVLSQVTTGRKVTMATVLEQYEKMMRVKSRSPQTINNNLLTIRAWLRDISMENSSPLSLSAEHVDQWINDKRSHITAATRRVNLGILSSFFDFLCDKGWIAGNPAHLVGVKLDQLSHEQKEPTEREAFTTQEIKRLLGHIKAEWDEAVNLLARINPAKGPTPPNAIRYQERIEAMRFWDFAVRLSHETGLRLGDICALEWRCFEKSGTLTVWTGKTDTRVEIAVSDALLDLVANIPVSDDKYVFPNERATQRDPKRRSGLSVNFSRICKAAGVEGKSFHCLRHTLASDKYSKADKEKLARKLAEVLTLGQIRDLLGHSSIKTTAKYVHDK